MRDCEVSGFDCRDTNMDNATNVTSLFVLTWKFTRKITLQKTVFAFFLVSLYSSRSYDIQHASYYGVE